MHSESNIELMIFSWEGWSLCYPLILSLFYLFSQKITPSFIICIIRGITRSFHHSWRIRWVLFLSSPPNLTCLLPPPRLGFFFFFFHARVDKLSIDWLRCYYSITSAMCRKQHSIQYEYGSTIIFSLLTWTSCSPATELTFHFTS